MISKHKKKTSTWYFHNKLISCCNIRNLRMHLYVNLMKMAWLLVYQRERMGLSGIPNGVWKLRRISWGFGLRFFSMEVLGCWKHNRKGWNWSLWFFLGSSIISCLSRRNFLWSRKLGYWGTVLSFYGKILGWKSGGKKAWGNCSDICLVSLLCMLKSSCFVNLRQGKFKLVRDCISSQKVWSRSIGIVFWWGGLEGLGTPIWAYWIRLFKSKVIWRGTQGMRVGRGSWTSWGWCFKAILRPTNRWGWAWTTQILRSWQAVWSI